jgi:hypothetical protein
MILKMMPEKWNGKVGANWIHITQDNDQWWDLVIIVINFHVP